MEQLIAYLVKLGIPEAEAKQMAQATTSTPEQTASWLEAGRVASRPPLSSKLPAADRNPAMRAGHKGQAYVDSTGSTGPLDYVLAGQGRNRDTPGEAQQPGPMNQIAGFMATLGLR